MPGKSIVLVPKASTSGYLAFDSLSLAAQSANSGDLIVLDPGRKIMPALC
jgi:hypothetical protein